MSCILERKFTVPCTESLSRKELHAREAEVNLFDLQLELQTNLSVLHQIERMQSYLEVRPGLLDGAKLNDKIRSNLWKIFDSVRAIIASELNEYSRERGEESQGWRLHYEKGEAIDLPEDVEERFERVRRTVNSPSAVAVLILAISPVSTPFCHSNCLTRGSIAFAQLSIAHLNDLPSDLSGVTGPILHELLHSLLIPHTRRGVMHDGRLPEGRREEEWPPIRCMGNVEAAILTHHPVMIEAERMTVELPISVVRPEGSTVVLSANVIYCVVVRSTVAERNIDWRGVEQSERRLSRLEEGDQLIVCTQCTVKCFALNSIPIVS